MGSIMTRDFELDVLPNVWTHPDTRVSILDEDMPDELRPPGAPSARLPHEHASQALAPNQGERDPHAAP